MSTIEHMPTQAQAASQMTPQRVAQSPESVTSPDPVLRSIRYSSAAPIHIGRYSVLQMLGQGGMGAVYACYDERLDRKVAVKVLRVGAASDRAVASARLVREGQALARLSHPNVVTVHEVGSTGEEVYVAMEFVKGMSLDVWATHKHSWQETLDVLIQAGRGLAAAHKAGIIHRDFKPQNVIVSEDGHVKVLDFGLARASGERVRKEWLGSGMSDSQVDLRGDFMRPLTVTGSLVGTPAYMSPEQYCGDPVTAASDQFSFCASLYQCLFGELPFTTSSYEGLRNDIMAGRVAPLPLRSPVPSWVYRSLCRGMQAFPEQRFASMNELLTTLDRRRGSRRALLAAALALATFTGATGFYAAQSTDPMIEVCPDASAELEGIWDSMRIQEVRTALAATGSPQATAIQASVLPQLDAYAEAWTQMRNEACRTHAEGRQADALFDRRMACLDQRRAGLATLGELLVHPEVDKLPNLAEAAFSLPPLDRCADASALLESVRPPENPDRRKRVQAHRENLSRAMVLHTAGRTEAGLELITEAADDEDAMAYFPLAAELDLNRGYLQMDLDPNKSAASLERALVNATRADHDLVAAQASSRLAFVRAIRLAQLDRAKADLPLVEARNSRFKGDVDVYAEYLNNTGYIETQTGDRREAVKKLEQAHALRVKHGRDKTPFALITLLNISITEYDEGLFADALEHAQEVHRSAKVLFGPGSYQATFSQQLIAFSHLKLGRPGKAIEVLSPLLDDIDGYMHAIAVALLAECELARNNRVLARQHLQAAHSGFPPETDSAAKTLHLLMEVAGVDRDEALVHAYYEQSMKHLEIYPDASEYRVATLKLSYGRALMSLGQAHEARVPLEQLQSSFPDTLLARHPSIVPQLSLELGRAYREVGDLDAAEKSLRRVLVQCGETRPLRRAEALYQLGLIAQARGLSATAVEQFRAATSLYAATAESDFPPFVDTRAALEHLTK